jgi:hypothetical protein
MVKEKKVKMINNDLQNTTQKIKSSIKFPTEYLENSGAPKGQSVPKSTLLQLVHYLFCCLFVLSVILRLTTSDYNLGISKLFLQYTIKVTNGFIYLKVTRMLEDTKGLIGRKTHNTMVKEKRVKMINNDLQNTTQKSTECSTIATNTTYIGDDLNWSKSCDFRLPR